MTDTDPNRLGPVTRADYAAILSRLDDVDRRLSEIESSLGRSRDGKPGSNAHEQKETK